MSTLDHFVDRVTRDVFYSAIGERIKATRETAKVSQPKLAAEARVSLSTIQHAEDGTSCSVLVLTRIADALDCTLDDLVPIGAES